MIESGLNAVQAAAAHGVTPPTARKCLGLFLAEGEPGLADASSRPSYLSKATDLAKALVIVELRKRRMLQSSTRSVGISESTVSRVLTRAGLSKLSDLDPVEPVVCYQLTTTGTARTATSEGNLRYQDSARQETTS